MSRNSVNLLFMIMVLVFDFQAQVLVFDFQAQERGDYNLKLKGRTLLIKQGSVSEQSKRVTSKAGVRKPLVDRHQISSMARNFGLEQWIDVAPSSQFTSYWYQRRPTEFRLEIEFAGLAVILKAAKAGGLNPDEDQIYSAPQQILAAVQKETADLKGVGLVDVPDIGSLSRAEAENNLIESRLVPEPIPQYSTGVAVNRVIPRSQDPAPAISVRPGASVRFGVSIQSEEPQISPDMKVAVSVSLQQKGGEQIRCSRGADRVCRCAIKGTSSGLSKGGYGLLLWVRPVRPPSDTPGWYLQRPPGNGIDRVAVDGSWVGIAQLGSAQWPPNEEDSFDVAVSIADTNTIDRLMAEIGVVVRNQPVGLKYDEALGLILMLGSK